MSTYIRDTQTTVEVLRESFSEEVEITQVCLEVLREATGEFPPIDFGNLPPGLTIIT